MTNPDYVKIAEGYSITAKKVVDRKDLDQSINIMLESEGPYLLEVMVEKEGNIFPMIEPGDSVSEIKLKLER